MSPSPKLNIIFGENGSGKTSLLESLFLFGFGRSFRTSKPASCIEEGATRFVLFAQVSQNQGERTSIGFSRDRKAEVQLKIAGEKVKQISRVAELMAVQLYSPRSSDVLIGSPSLRRRFMDWGVFHVEHGFNQLHGRFSKALAQRNALLKSHSRSDEQLAYWTDLVVSLSEQIDCLRRRYIDDLRPVLLDNLSRFLPEISLSMRYKSGWEEGAALADVMQRTQEVDRRRGYTATGAHKADMQLYADGQPVAEVLSRGQLRMAMAALQLSQARLLKQSANKDCVILIDDFTAELDKGRQHLLISSLLACDSQVFVTMIERPSPEFLGQFENYKMFHVEHGRVTEECA